MDLARTAGLFDGTDHRPWCSSNLHFGGSFVQMVSSYDHDPIVICCREPGGFFSKTIALVQRTSVALVVFLWSGMTSFTDTSDYWRHVTNGGMEVTS